MDHRPVRLPPGPRHNLFQGGPSSRRQNPAALRQDSQAPGIFQQPREDELVERNTQGEYVIAEPERIYAHVDQERTAEEVEIGMVDTVMELLRRTAEDQKRAMPAVFGDELFSEEMFRDMPEAWKLSLKKKLASIDRDQWMFQADMEFGKR